MNRQELAAILRAMADEITSFGEGMFMLSVSEDLADAITEHISGTIRPEGKDFFLWPDSVRGSTEHQLVHINSALPPKTFAWRKGKR